MKYLIEYIEKFKINCKICGSDDITVCTTLDNGLVFECGRCDEIEEVENDEEY